MNYKLNDNSKYLASEYKINIELNYFFTAKKKTRKYSRADCRV